MRQVIPPPPGDAPGTTNQVVPGHQWVFFVALGQCMPDVTVD